MDNQSGGKGAALLGHGANHFDCREMLRFHLKKQGQACQLSAYKKNEKAVIRAGYSAKTEQVQSSRLLSNVMVQAAIDERMKDREKRIRIKAYWAQCDDISRAWAERGHSNPPPVFPALPPDLVGLECGARTRAGTPCKQKGLFSNSRCKWHGGCSTGPKTEAGKEQSRINGRKGGRPKRKNPSHTPT